MSVKLDPSLNSSLYTPIQVPNSSKISFENMHMYFQPIAEVMVQHMYGSIVMCDASGHKCVSSVSISRFTDLA
jgi:hypothetical protein